MWPELFNSVTPEERKQEFQDGVREGIQMSDEVLNEITRDFYKSVKRGLLKIKLTTGTATNHTCNCDYCPNNNN